MNKKQILLTSLLLLVTLFLATAQKPVKIKAKNLQLLLGSWKGTLTYLDYSSGKPYSMPADIEIKQGKKSNVLILSNLYLNEPKANSMDTLTISSNGQMINNAKVKSNRKLSNGSREIVTETLGIDGNDDKEAIIRTTYVFGKNIYTHIKEVQFKGEDGWIKRHEYSYTPK